MVEKRFLRPGHAEGDIRRGSQRREGGHGDPLFPAEAEKLLLGEERVELHLEDGRRDPRSGEEIAEERSRAVANADAAHDSGPDEFLHRPPGLRQRDIDHLHSRLGCRRVVDPARGIADVEGDESLGDREMDEVEIEVVEAEVDKRPLRGRADMPWVVEGVPKL